MVSITELLEVFRKEKAFIAKDYIEKKAKAINNFFRNEGLDAAVVGISGGVDSAIVLGLLHTASKMPDSPLKQILAISMPIKYSQGVTGQDIAANKANLVMEHFGYNYYEVELSKASLGIVMGSFDVNPDNTEEAKRDRAFARGQMDSILRTPVLYYHAAILQTAGYKSIVVGTTNKSEGSYIGFFGKASDAMVDLQPIADIYKSEVYAVADELKIPKEITNDKPRGDVWDGKCDEEMIGAPYWFLELYLSAKENIFHNMSLKIALANSSKEEATQISQWVENIENLHNKNAHKYKVGNPARFINLYPVEIHNGWNIKAI